MLLIDTYIWYLNARACHEPGVRAGPGLAETLGSVMGRVGPGRDVLNMDGPGRAGNN